MTDTPSVYDYEDVEKRIDRMSGKTDNICKKLEPGKTAEKGSYKIHKNDVAKKVAG